MTRRCKGDHAIYLDWCRVPADDFDESFMFYNRVTRLRRRRIHGDILIYLEYPLNIMSSRETYSLFSLCYAQKRISDSYRRSFFQLAGEPKPGFIGLLLHSNSISKRGEMPFGKWFLSGCQQMEFERKVWLWLTSHDIPHSESDCVIWYNHDFTYQPSGDTHSSFNFPSISKKEDTWGDRSFSELKISHKPPPHWYCPRPSGRVFWIFSVTLKAQSSDQKRRKRAGLSALKNCGAFRNLKSH